jgi:hypothetical protein
MKRTRAETKTKTKRASDEDLLAEYQEGLKIDKHALDDMWEVQPDLFYRIAERCVLLRSQRDAAKQDLAMIEAEADGRVRRKAAKDGTKLTEAGVKNKLRLDPDVEAAQEEYLRLVTLVGKFEAMKESYDQRAKALRELVALHLASYFDAQSSRRNDGLLKERHAENARSAMNEARRRA